LHLVDGTSEDPAGDYQTIIGELEAYGGELADKPRVTALNKIDALDDKERAEAKTALEAVAGPVLMMSGVSREGLTDVLRAVRSEITDDRIRTKTLQEEPEPWHP
jgi:GTP-binding protein